MPFTPYQIVYADPPWSYQDEARSGDRGAIFKYPTMTIDRIKNLPVANICADDCCLFLWVTPPLLPDCLDVMASWGFQYKTRAFTWVKTCKGREDRFQWGMGNWTRSNAEDVLLGVRGNPTRVDKGVHSVVAAPRSRHSEKPGEVRDRIVKLMGDVPRIELFARETVQGWHALGNAIQDMDIQEALKAIQEGTLDMDEQTVVGRPSEGDLWRFITEE